MPEPPTTNRFRRSVLLPQLERPTTRAVADRGANSAIAMIERRSFFFFFFIVVFLFSRVETVNVEWPC